MRPWPGSRLPRPATLIAQVFLLLLGLLNSRRAAADSKKADPYALVEELARALVLVDGSYVEPVPRQRLLDGALRGLVSSLDPHSSYMDPTEFRAFQSETQGSFAGIGVELDARGDELVVLSVLEEGPAARAGIQLGDRLVSVQGLPVRGTRLEDLAKRLRGPAGTQVRLGLLRAGRSEPLVLELVREQLRVRSVLGARLEGDLAYVRIRLFQEGTHEEFREVLERIRAQGRAPLRGAVLDLRHDPGGLVQEALSIADECLTEGLIYSTRHQGQVLEEVQASSGGLLADVPLSVLLSEYSASAAELVAGALQDHGRAELVGRRSFGKGSVQSIVALPSGGGLRLTTARNYTPRGRSLQALGVMPDVLVEGPEPPPALYTGSSERDLDGHLPPEGGGPWREPLRLTTAHPLRIAAFAGPGPIAMPQESEDPVLVLAWRRLRERLGGTGAATESP